MYDRRKGKIRGCNFRFFPSSIDPVNTIFASGSPEHIFLRLILSVGHLSDNQCLRCHLFRSSSSQHRYCSSDSHQSDNTRHARKLSTPIGPSLLEICFQTSCRNRLRHPNPPRYGSQANYSCLRCRTLIRHCRESLTVHHLHLLRNTVHHLLFV